MDGRNGFPRFRFRRRRGRQVCAGPGRGLPLRQPPELARQLDCNLHLKRNILCSLFNSPWQTKAANFLKIQFIHSNSRMGNITKWGNAYALNGIPDTCIVHQKEGGSKDELPAFWPLKAFTDMRSRSEVSCLTPSGLLRTFQSKGGSSRTKSIKNECKIHVLNRTPPEAQYPTTADFRKPVRYSLFESFWQDFESFHEARLIETGRCTVPLKRGANLPAES